MKLSVLLAAFLMCSLGTSAQSKEDKKAIKETALNYIEGYFHKDVERMEKALHPELVKRSVIKTKEGMEFVINLGATYMIMRTANNNNRHAANPEGPIESEVEIYDIVGNAATVKVSTNQYSFIDYLHIAKYKDEWKIINVLWTDVPKEE
jgi:hypothetical protein